MRGRLGAVGAGGGCFSLRGHGPPDFDNARVCRSDNTSGKGGTVYDQRCVFRGVRSRRDEPQAGGFFLLLPPAWPWEFGESVGGARCPKRETVP